jgi:hypothetical protein
MTWARCHKRVVTIVIRICSDFVGAVKVIACIEDPVVFKMILTHLDRKNASAQAPGCYPVGRRRMPACPADMWSATGFTKPD